MLIVVYYDGYNGKKAFSVTFQQKTVKVFAPNETCAIVAAADYFERRWQEYDYYAYCDVRPLVTNH